MPAQYVYQSLTLSLLLTLSARFKDPVLRYLLLTLFLAYQYYYLRTRDRAMETNSPKLRALILVLIASSLGMALAIKTGRIVVVH